VLDCDVPSVPRVFQGQVYEVRGRNLIDGDGELVNKQFAKRRQVLPNILHCLLFDSRRTYGIGVYV
jgi:hypothetical protein